jgi:hypothetical protein
MEAGAVPEKAMISHRGEKYEIGRGKRFYGIWMVGAPYEAPIDRWPESRDGWEQAWTRFVALETPGTIRAVDQGRSRSLLHLRRDGSAGNAAARGGAGGGTAVLEDRQAVEDAPPVEDRPAEVLTGRRVTALLSGEGLLVLGVVLGLAGLFPSYAGGQSLLSQGDQVVPHLLYVVSWAVSAGVIALGVARPGMARRGAERAAAMFALGLSAVTFGLFLADLGGVISGGASLGTGLVVSLLGWLACTAGAAIALRAACHDDAGYGQARWARPRLGVTRPRRGHAGPLALLVLAGIGTATAFAPSWDSYTLATTSTGTTQTITAGNAFDNPGLAIAGNVAVMVAVIAVAALAALWRPARQGALLLAGAIVPLAAQAISALIQVSTPATDAMFGISRAEASATGLTISSGVTATFWVYCVFVIALLISCAWLFTTPGHPAMPAIKGMPTGPWPPIAGGDHGPGAVGDPQGDGADSGSGAEDNEDSTYA